MSDRNNNPRRILAIASGGGHWIQLLRLRPAFSGHHVTWVTVHPEDQVDVGDDRFRTVTDATRWNPLRLILLSVQLLLILMRERPHVVISTGAAPGYLAFRLARLFGARTLWLDSIANVSCLSMSGQRAGRFTDVWLTQWPQLASKDGPQYFGAVL